MPSTSHPILIGCSGWSYPEWDEVFYPAGMDSSDYLPWYTDHFDVVEVDSTFYRIPNPRMVLAWRDRSPSGFRFAPKVPQVITHQKQLIDCESDIAKFVAAIEPLGEKLSRALLQMGYFNRDAFPTLEGFLEVLDPFLEAWPHSRVPLAVEIRNPRWMVVELAEVLRRHNAALTLTWQKWMPRPAEVINRFDPVTAPFTYLRLIGNREAIEKLTTTFNKIVVDKSEELAEATLVIEELARCVPAFVFINNHFAGFAPETARQLQRLLGIPVAVPPSRPRTTLFD